MTSARRTMEGVDGSDVDAHLRAVLGGDRERYRPVVDACEAHVRLVLAAMVPDAALVDDLVDEVFLTAYLKLADYQPGTDFLRWLKEIARNLAQNERRRWARHEKLKRGYRASLEELARPSDERLLAADDGLLAALLGCVEQLERTPAELVQRHYFEGLSAADIGRALRRPDSWVRLVLYRARTAIARCLETKGIGYADV